ncbi:MAG: helix-turn-helix domain-containing protein [Christensenellales bacterium]
MLRQERLRRGWTQQYVAKKSGVTKSAILLLETGKTKPSYDVLVKLLDLFDCNDPRILFGAATPDNTKEPDGNQAE